jgi:hypothetical protein
MTEAKIERLERVLWELERVGEELFDLGYIDVGNEIQDMLYAMDKELEGVVEGRE